MAMSLLMIAVALALAAVWLFLSFLPAKSRTIRAAKKLGRKRISGYDRKTCRLFIPAGGRNFGLCLCVSVCVPMVVKTL
eukprot:2624101-Amphidinium_carterae.1